MCNKDSAAAIHIKRGVYSLINQQVIHLPVQVGGERRMEPRSKIICRKNR
jgi:hypothetical protein